MKNNHKFTLFLLGALGLSLVLCSCTSQPEPSQSMILKAFLKQDVPSIHVHQLHLNPKHYLILDAREEVEFTISHLPHAFHFGFEKPNFDLLNGIRKDQPIAVYCSVGVRSEKITRKLREMGFTGAVNVEGSLFEWINQNYTLVDTTGQTTYNVHAYNAFWGRWIKNEQYQKIY
jgi:rhodanese-related sulfurtransferase